MQDEFRPRPGLQDARLRRLEDRHHARPDLGPHEVEAHAARPFFFEHPTDAEIDLVADLEGVDVDSALRHVADDMLSVRSDCRQFFRRCEVLPDGGRRLFHEIRPIVAQKDDEVWLETSLLGTTRRLDGVVQSIDSIFTDPQADAGVLAPMLCEQHERIHRPGPILPRFVVPFHVQCVIAVDPDKLGILGQTADRKCERENDKQRDLHVHNNILIIN
jgi:hypothetical protein